MADLYGTNAYSSPTPSSSSASLPLESEDLTTFLQQLLHPTTNTSSASGDCCIPFRNKQGSLPSSSFASVPESMPVTGLHSSIGLERDGVGRMGIGVGPSTYVGESSSGFNFGGGGGGYYDDVSRKGFSFGDGLGINDQMQRESNEFNFENENGAGASEAPSNPVKSRSSSKRSRAAEVHNLSEKRRRSRINEKLRALQKLIPNSNKSDKASMLDEAIDYLKQLQLQVQMLSMRNGVSLHPLCIPGVGQSLHMPQEGASFGGGDDMLNTIGPPGAYPLMHGSSVPPSFDISRHCNSSNQSIQPTMNDISNSGLASGLDPSLEAHARYKSFNFSSPPKDVHKEETYHGETSNTRKRSPGANL